MIQLPFLRRYSSATLFVCALLCVFGSKLAVIDRYGTDLPFQDQWGKEADFVLAPLREGNPAWLQGALLPHNEHRVYFTLGVDVLLTQVSGQWDARQECVVSAFLHAAIAASLALFAWRRLPGGWGLVSAGVIVALTALPLAWDNVLWAFQSQFYFLIGFSLLAMDGLLRETFSARWWLGLLAMLCALVSMGSGFLCALALLPLFLRDMMGAGRSWKTWLSLIATAALLALGWYLHFEPPWHASLRAGNLSDFATYAAHCLAWPAPAHVMFGLVFYSPFLLLGACWLRHGAPPGPAGHALRFTVAMGAWTLLQIAAVSYARGNGGGVPANRYGDVLAIGIIANTFALALLAPALGNKRRGWLVWAAAWLVVLGLSVATELTKIYRDELPQHRRQTEAFESSVRAYILDGDAAVLRNRPIPFPNYDWFIRLLDRPSIRAILPPSVSNPSHVSMLSSMASHLTKLGWVVMIIGVIGLALAAVRRAPA
ncbi:MAG: hypothetical protein QOD12_1730 [Verrucomicrobiota bacterium]